MQCSALHCKKNTAFISLNATLVFKLTLDLLCNLSLDAKLLDRLFRIQSTHLFQGVVLTMGSIFVNFPLNGSQIESSRILVTHALLFLVHSVEL